MTTTEIAKPQQETAFQLKGSLFTLTVLHLQSGNPSAFSNQLEATIKQAPKFFHNAPLVIDVNDFPFATEALDLTSICEILRQHQLIPVGIRGGNPAINTQAADANLAVLANTQSSDTVKAPSKVKTSKQKAKVAAEAPPTPAPTQTATKVITQPIRSGQQVYAKGGDLIVLAAVSHGAEILADGHIHVYGPLRGRALAGIMGDTNAQIFCKGLEAELVSIAGRYLINEQLASFKEQGPVHIYLEEDQLQIKPL